MPDALDLDPPERRIAVAGDWHRNQLWVEQLLPELARQSPGIRTILQVGDFGLSPDARGRRFLEDVDYSCREAGVERVLVTPGNHEHHDWLDSEFEAAGGEPLLVSETVSVLPRGYRFTLGDRLFMSFGGAASVDYEQRRAGIDWFISEVPTDEDVAAAIAAGPVDVLLTHETVEGGTAAVTQLLTRPSSWPLEALYFSADSRRRVTQVWEATRPQILFHGHMHVADEIELADGRRVYSLGRDYQQHNAGILDLDTLGWQWIDSPR
ncbi:metallophosphoesterase family protein [Leifsonia xyli]|uniref:metallophosphoesterase family protein n=1 Tax=Leifsonia xyli TaxID=1575 RepID=UPI003D6661EF